MSEFCLLINNNVGALRLYVLCRLEIEMLFEEYAIVIWDSVIKGAQPSSSVAGREIAQQMGSLRK